MCSASVSYLLMSVIARSVFVRSFVRSFIYLCIYLFLTSPVRPIISKSTGPIFVKFLGLVEQLILMMNLKLFFGPSRDIAIGTYFCWFLSRKLMGVVGRRRLVAQPGGLTLGI